MGEFAADCFGPALAMGPVAASRKVETAEALAGELPMTLAAMSNGNLDTWRATIIATELSEASAASCAVVEALILPAALREAPGAATMRVRRVLARIDADALRVKAAKERCLDMGAPPARGGMIPVQTVTVDKPVDALDRDLLARGEDKGERTGTAESGAAGSGAGLGYLSPLADTDDYGQPTPARTRCWGRAGRRSAPWDKRSPASG